MCSYDVFRSIRAPSFGGSIPLSVPCCLNSFHPKLWGSKMWIPFGSKDTHPAMASSDGSFPIPSEDISATISELKLLYHSDRWFMQSLFSRSSYSCFMTPNNTFVHQNFYRSTTLTGGAIKDPVKIHDLFLYICCWLDTKRPACWECSTPGTIPLCCDITILGIFSEILYILLCVLGCIKKWFVLPVF